MREVEPDLHTCPRSCEQQLATGIHCYPPYQLALLQPAHNNLLQGQYGESFNGGGNLDGTSTTSVPPGRFIIAELLSVEPVVSAQMWLHEARLSMDLPTCLLHSSDCM